MLIVGLMSGTSVDGIDAALVEIDRAPDRFEWRLIHFVETPWSEPMRSAILKACANEATPSEIALLNFAIGEEFATAAKRCAEEAGVGVARVDAIGSHGQTIWHQPEAAMIGGRSTSATLQIGEGAVIAARTGRTVVSDFRTADMAVGGLGAPLVPYVDYTLFSDLNETRAIQNLGGIGNVTYLRANAGIDDVIAFDTGPANMVIDRIAQRVTNGSKLRDDGGEIAARGAVNDALLNVALGHPYFTQFPPKTTGRETFGDDYADTLFDEAMKRALTPQSILATVTALTAETIASAYVRWLTPRGAIDRVILGGGGVKNATLVAMLRQRLRPATVDFHTDFGLPDEAKEAVAFAILAFETLHRRPSNVPSATGARSSAILGKISYA